MLKTVGKFKIDQGEYYQKIIKLRTNGGYDSVNLTDATAIEVKLRNADSTVLTLNLASGVAKVGSGISGDITVTITAAQTALLKRGADQNMEINYTIDSKKTIVVLQGVLDVTNPSLV